MLKLQETYSLKEIEFKVIYSARRSLGISVLPDSTVIVRVPFRTSLKTINRIVEEKSDWIIKHRDRYKEKGMSNQNRLYNNGEVHLFRGNDCVLKVEKSVKPFVRFYDGTISLGLAKTDDPRVIKALLYRGYKNEAINTFPGKLTAVLQKYENQMFKPSGLVIRTMKRRWGSCSNKGVITLSTELIKLPDHFTEYVIIHELCHLKHHNHGPRFYNLLSDLYPDWKSVRKELRKYVL